MVAVPGLILQSDSRMPWHVRRWGCLFRSAGAVAEHIVGRPMTESEIERHYQACTLSGAMVSDADWEGNELPLERIMDNHHTLGKLGIVAGNERWYCSVTDLTRVINVALRIMGDVRHRAVNVGKVPLREGVSGWGSDRGDLAILEGHMPGRWSHFRFGTVGGEVLWDPASPEPEIGYEISRRIIRVTAV